VRIPTRSPVRCSRAATPAAARGLDEHRLLPSAQHQQLARPTYESLEAIGVEVLGGEAQPVAIGGDLDDPRSEDSRNRITQPCNSLRLDGGVSLPPDRVGELVDRHRPATTRCKYLERRPVPPRQHALDAFDGKRPEDPDAHEPSVLVGLSCGVGLGIVAVDATRYRLDTGDWLHPAMTPRIGSSLVTTILCATLAIPAQAVAAGDDLNQHCSAWRADPRLVPRTADAAAAWLAQCPDPAGLPPKADAAQTWLG
jgi:hypothetical protein